MYILSILFVLITNPWTWELLSFDLFLFLLTVCSSILLFLSFLRSSKKILFLFCLILIPILVIQWKTTPNNNLTYINATDEQLLNIRRSEIPLLRLNLLDQPLVFNPGRYIINKPDYIFYKFQQNILRSIDLNLYFFGNHPREIPGHREFDKFSFLFLPFFILGVITGLKSHRLQISISFLIPLAPLTLIGQNNPVGPFVLFPFFAATITIGLFHVAKEVLMKLKIRTN